MWQEFKEIKSGRIALREFGLTIGAILVILGDIALWRTRPLYPYLLALGFTLIVLGLARPEALKPLQKAWMALSIVIGFFMSRLILTVLFYIVITPMSLAMRIFGKDILDEKIEKEKNSYWVYRPEGEKERSSYENQY